MDIDPWPPFYITISNLDSVDEHFLRHQKVDGATNTQAEIANIEEERYSYLSGGHVNKGDNSVSAGHYKTNLRPSKHVWRTLQAYKCVRPAFCELGQSRAAFGPDTFEI